MRLKILLVLIFMLVAPAQAAQTATDWRADLDFLASELPARHVNLYANVSEADFNAAVEALRADIPTLSDDEIIVRLMQLVTLVGDPHTDLMWAQYGAITYFPLSLQSYSDGIYAVAAPSQHPDAAGGRLIAIDDMPIDDVMARVATVIPHDTPGWVAFMAPRAVLIAPRVLAPLGIINDPSSATYTLQHADGTQVQVALTPITPTAMSQVQWVRAVDPGHDYPISWERRNPDNYWYQMLPDRDALYVAYNACVEIPGYPVGELTAEVMAAYEEHRPDRLIIDLRRNSGGDSRLLAPLIDAIIAQPDLTRLYVLIGRQTFSSAVLNAIELRERTPALLVGEPAGQRPNHFGDYRSFTLPQSGLTVIYATKYFVWLEDDPALLAPDIEVPTTGLDILNIHDPVLETALTH